MDFVNPNIYVFNILMSCKAFNIVDNLAKFVVHALEEKKDYKSLLSVRTKLNIIRCTTR
jgi:hypothetical protein